MRNMRTSKTEADIDFPILFDKEVEDVKIALLQIKK